MCFAKKKKEKKKDCYIFGASFAYGCKINETEVLETGFKTETNAQTEKKQQQHKARGLNV